MSAAYMCDVCRSVVDDSPPNKYGLHVTYEAKRTPGNNREYAASKIEIQIVPSKEWSLFSKSEPKQLCALCLADGIEQIAQELRQENGRWRSNIIQDRRAEVLELDGNQRARFLR